MTKRPIISRRSLLAGLWLAGSYPAWGLDRRGEDQGIGGTGRRNDDRGIGGTGIIGVIQRFGSIFVNGERIGYAPDVSVVMDGVAASAKMLRIGQVVRVVALRQANGTLATHRIDVTSEVAGPIENVKAGEITVLGQTVITAGKESWRRPGTYVAVFGLRRTDGVIVASRVEPRHDSTARVVGLLERVRGDVQIGGLRLDGVNALVGQRVQAEGHVVQGVMRVSHATPDDLSDFAGTSRLLIEGYVRRAGSELQFGSGYVARDVSRFQPATGEARVVVDAMRDSGSGLRVEAVRSVDRFPGASISTPHRPDLGPNAVPGPGGEPNGPGGLPNGPAGPGGSAGQTIGPSGPGQTIGPSGPLPGSGGFGVPGGLGGGGGRR
jgi:hypothetical protein